MIPAAFDYHAPASLPEAIALLSRFGDSAKVISGGQSLLPLLKLRLGAAEHLVDIGRIAGWSTFARKAAPCASAAGRASRCWNAPRSCAPATRSCSTRRA